MKGGGCGPRSHMELTQEQTIEYLNYRIQKLEALLKSANKSNDRLMRALEARAEKPVADAQEEKA